MKFIVAQIGARHHYAIPRILARRDHLEALYTDSCTNCGIARLLDAIIPSRLRRGTLGQLLQREVTGVPAGRIRSTDCLLWNHLLRRRPNDSFADRDRVGALLSRDMIRWGTGNATHIYSMFGEGIEFLHLAKERGLTVCVDVFITPVAHRIIAEERRRFPEWEGAPMPWDSRLEPRIREILDVADLLLCPGENVVDGLQPFGNHSGKVRVVPYGSGANFGGRINKPTAGRVLFAGTAQLRKGIHYFAAATKQLGRHQCDFRVAGGVTDTIRRLPECGALNFLGHISRAEMVEEFLQADVLVLPTLAEGSASVISEALVAGLPVITTRSAGSMVTHGHGGLIVPERDAEALAVAIDDVVRNRTRRRELANEAQTIARLFSEEEWGNRLLAAFDGSSATLSTDAHPARQGVESLRA